MSAEIIDFGHPKSTSTNSTPRVRLPKQKSVRPNTGGGGTPAGDPIFAAIEKHRIAVQAIDDWAGDPLPGELLDHCHQCEVQLAVTKPATLAGVMAILRYSHNNQYSRSGECLFGEVGSGSDPRCELPAWLTVIEQSLKQIAAPRAI
jgi:hypothetical protein